MLNCELITPLANQYVAREIMLVLYFNNFSLPFKSDSSIINPKPATSPPIDFTNCAAAKAVPPVANKSS